MELTAIAQWLNTAFAGYDYAILQALHSLAGTAGGVFTPLRPAARHRTPGSAKSRKRRLPPLKEAAASV